MKHFIVTIGREFGSLGKAAGEQLANELGIQFYDRDLVKKAASELEVYPYRLAKLDESRPSVLQQYIFGTTDADKLIEIQSGIIRELAEGESCVFIGRCADYVLRDRDDVLNVFIYAPDKVRLQHLLEEYRDKEEYREKLNTAEDFIHFEDEIRELMHTTDQKRSDYYKYVTGSLRSERYHKDLIINTGTLGVNGAVQAIKAAVMAKFGGD